MSSSIGGIGVSHGMDMAQRVQARFKRLDKNGDGSIDKAEFTAGHKGKGGQTADAIFAMLDADQNGKIDATENANGMAKIHEEMKAKFGNQQDGKSEFSDILLQIMVKNQGDKTHPIEASQQPDLADLLSQNGQGDPNAATPTGSPSNPLSDLVAQMMKTFQQGSNYSQSGSFQISASLNLVQITA